jgi:prepilin-type N-terminal cleavage/methylation domain-containing protein
MRGFSIIEIVVVISILTIIVGLMITSSTGEYRSVILRSDRETLVVLLQHARALSMQGACSGTCYSSPGHGVAIIQNEIILFQGNSFSESDVSYSTSFQTDEHTTYAGLSEVVFAALSGKVSTSGDMVLVDSLGKTATITVSHTGRIVWSR